VPPKREDDVRKKESVRAVRHCQKQVVPEKSVVSEKKTLREEGGLLV
jgi:hypothetical protein